MLYRFLSSSAEVEILGNLWLSKAKPSNDKSTISGAPSPVISNLKSEI